MINNQMGNVMYNVRVSTVGKDVFVFKVSNGYMQEKSGHAEGSLYYHRTGDLLCT